MWLKNDYLNAAISKFVIIFFSFLNTVIINRFLGLELRGEFAYFLNIVNVLSVILSVAISSSLPFLRQKYGEQSVSDILRVVNAQLLIYVVLISIACFLFDFEGVAYILIASLFLQYANQLDFIVMIVDIRKRNVLIVFSIFVYFLTLLTSYLFFKGDVDVVIFSFILYAVVRVLFYIKSLKPYFSIK